MFNNYKKNKPKNLPKYDRGGEGRASVDNTRTIYGGSEDASTGSSIGNTESGTQNIYNEKRGSNISAGQINQYAQIGTSVGAGATNVMGAYQNPESSYTDKYNSTAKAATGVTSAISPVWGAATQATYSIAAPIKNAMESSGENGRKASYIAGHIFDPLSTFATDAGTGTWSPKAYEKQYQAEHNPQGQFAGGGMNIQPNAIPQYPTGGTMPRLKPRNFAAEKANYEEATRGANQGDGSGISSAELAYKYSKLIDPTGATSAVEIGKNFYTGNAQDPIDYLGLIRIPFVKQGMKPLSKLAKQGNKASVLNNIITKSNDVAESFSYGGVSQSDVIHAPEMGGYFRKKSR